MMTFRRGRGHGSGMVKQLVKDIKDRKLVPELQDQVSKVVRCLYTEDFLREVSRTEIPKKIVGINVEALNRFERWSRSLLSQLWLRMVWFPIRRMVLRFLVTEN